MRFILPRLHWKSLRARFLLAVSVWVVVGISAVGLATTYVFSRHIEQEYHEELEVHIVELANLAQFEGGKIRLARPLSDPRYQVSLSGFYWQVSVDGGETLRSPSMSRRELDPEIAHAQTIDHSYEQGPSGPAIAYGMVRHAPSGQTVHFVIATDRRILDQTVSRFVNDLVRWLLMLGLGLFATGLSVVLFGLRPLDRLASALARLKAGRIDRIDGTYPAEIQPLVSDLNAFIAHNQAVVERSRAQAGNLAHALRTPLAIVTDEAERLASGADARESAEVLIDQSRIMVRHIDYNLARARASGPTQMGDPSTSLPSGLSPLIEAMRKLHPHVVWYLEVETDQEMRIAIDPVDFIELVSNILDNAGKWARHAVTVPIQVHAGAILLTVKDDGPGMTAEQIADATRSGVRFDETRSGAGLGLAIAKDIANTWDVGLEIVSPPQDGLTVELAFRPR